MSWTVWGEYYADADATNLRIYQPVIFNRDVSLLACRAWFIVCNNPTLTSIQMKIYSNSSSDTPRSLIATSTNTVTKAQMITLANGIKEIYFEFNYVSLKGTDTYNFVPVLNGYSSATVTKNIAWKKAFPDPPYRTGLTIDSNFVMSSPYDLTFVGADI